MRQAFLLFTLSCAFLAAAEKSARRGDARPAASPPVPLVEGALPNGLRYTVLPHRRELGRVSVRLVVLAGALDERDDERGYAHFIEHMAFNGTRHHPPGTFIQFFQRLGVAFGPDLCANTSFTHTIYRLDLPAGRTALLGEALQVLRDFADGIAFAPADVQREKGVVLSELRARHTDDWQVEAQRLRALYGGTLLPERIPTGDPGIIERATAESLRAFYRRCYHPARLRLTVVGDIDPAGARQLLQEHFGSLRGEARAATQVLPVAPKPSALRAHVIASATAPAANIALTVVAPRAADTRAGFEADFANSVVIHALNRRFFERRARAADRFGGAGASSADGPDDRLVHYTAWASAATDDWEAAVGLIENEVRRARQDGFTAAELQEAAASLLAAARANIEQLGGELVDQVASSIAATHAAGREWRHPAAAFELEESFLSRFSVTAATAAIRALLADDQAHLLLVQNTPLPGRREALLAAYRASAARPLEPVPLTSTASLQFRYGDFGPPGEVAQRRKDEALGLDLVRFANGVCLNLRPSQTEPGRFRLTARLGRGVADLPHHQPGLGHLAAHLIGECDLGRHSREEVTRLLSLRAVSSHGTYGDCQRIFEIGGPARELPFALQLLTARIADLKLEGSRLASAVSDYGSCRSSHLEDAASHAQVSTMTLMTCGDARLREPPPDKVGQYPFADIAAWVRSYWLEGPLEIGIAGDFDANAIVGTAAASLGTLSPRRHLPILAGDHLILRTRAVQETREEPLADQAAAVRVSWGVPNSADVRRRRTLTLACNVLVDRLHHRLRQELGATYSPTGGFDGDQRERAFGFASIALTFAPDRAAEHTRRAVAIAGEFARTGATAEEFERRRAPLLASATEALRSNEWWLDTILAYAQSEPAVLDDARTLGTIYAELTREDVNRVAAECFRADAANTVIIMPVPPAASPEDQTPAAVLERQATAKMKHGDFAGAIADLTQAIALDPNNAGLYQSRGDAKGQSGDLAGTIVDWDKVIALDPKNATAFSNRASGKFSLGDQAGALADCDRAIELDPRLANAYSNRAAIKVLRSDFDGCIADATKAIELDATNAMSFANRASGRMNKGDREGALVDITRAIALAPAGAAAYNTRGFLKQGAGDLAGAIADYDQAIKVQPDFILAYNNRGHARKAKGDTFGAMDDFDQALKLSTPSARPPSLDLLAQAQAAPPPAQPDVAPAPRARPNATPVPRAVSSIPNSPEAAALALVRSGDAKRSKRDYAGALADYNQAIELDPRLATAYCSRGYVQEARNNPAAAFADFDMAVTLNPAYVPAYNGRGYARQARGDFDRAILDYSEAIQRSASFAPAYFNRGHAHQARGGLAAALADYNKVIAINPKYTGVHSNRANVRHAAGDFEGALADYDQAITVAKDSAHYPQLFRWVVRRRLQRGDPPTDLAKVIQPWSATWTRTIGRFLLGELTEAAFIAAASAGPGRTPLSRPCEAYYFAGAMCLVNGEFARARELFEKCVATKQVRFSTFMLARAELTRMPAAPPGARSP